MQIRSRFLAACLAVTLPSCLWAEDASLVAAFDAIEQGDWPAAYGLAGQDLLAQQLITWTRLREGEGEFPEYTAFLAAHPDWPGLDRLRAKGEEAITEQTAAVDVITYFGGADPQSGWGGLRLSQAYLALGQPDKAAEVLRKIWTGYGLTQEEFDALIAAFGPQLAPLNAARVDAMLWRWKVEDAARLVPTLPADQRALAEARIALIRKRDTATDLVNAVPQALRGNVGLAYDVFSNLADRGEYTQAVAVLAERTHDVALLEQPLRWSGWRRTLARWEMRQARYDSAYLLASQHHLTAEDGEAYADLEWLAGFISLRFLKDPERALTHFRAVDAAVESPISDGRAAYWIGRTYDALGDATAAQTAYTQAAQHQTAFYGLLAAERLGLSLDPAMIGNEVFAPFAGSAVAGSELAKAGFELIDADQRTPAVLFFAKLGQTLDRNDLGTLGQELLRRNEPFLALLLAKSGVARGMVIPELYFPLHDLRKMDLPVAPELALSIARRESEFNHTVGSPVGALGLMQLMPGTAEDVAKELGLPYSRARLTADWAYNATLGSQYLFGLQDRFGDSPVMIAAGYNAGPARPTDWMAERGDPRNGSVDVIDWIELIPYRETRNYVQRVTESIPIYRARLTGQVGPIDFTSLLIGQTPIRRPVPRPWTEGAVTADPKPPSQ